MIHLRVRRVNRLPGRARPVVGRVNVCLLLSFIAVVIVSVLAVVRRAAVMCAALAGSGVFWSVVVMLDCHFHASLLACYIPSFPENFCINASD
jgi:hypothetical protein